MIDITADHPDILYVGRVDRSNPTAPALSFPGISIRARFNGDAVDAVIRDFGNAEISNYYNIIVDGGEPTLLRLSPGEAVYELARDMGSGEHTVEIFKRGESGPNGSPNAGKAEFLGFRIREGHDLLKVAPKPRRMEFIGDSITCGYGNEIAVPDPANLTYTPENSNAYNAFGAIAARALGAEYLAVAYSGRGLVRNFEDAPGKTVPEMYLDTLPESPDAARWDVSAYTPHAIVINLGTNDFSQGLDLDALARMRERFRHTYVRFLKTLRGYYPDAAIILSVGPMLSDDSPEGYDAWTSIRADVGEVIAARRDGGDDRIHLIVFSPQTAPFGEDRHPSGETHQKMAAQLVSFVNGHHLMP
jgi:lysophospholipase L1-like esterase